MHPAINDLIEWSLEDAVEYNGYKVGPRIYSAVAPRRTPQFPLIIYTVLDLDDEYTFGGVRGIRQHWWKLLLGIQVVDNSDTDRYANGLNQAMDVILNPLAVNKRWLDAWSDKFEVNLFQREGAIPPSQRVEALPDEPTSQHVFYRGGEYRVIMIGEG